MNESDYLKKLVKQGESDVLEFQKKVNKETVAKVLSSFLNTKGGTVLIGIDSDGKVLGIEINNKDFWSFQEYLIQSIVPEASIEVRNIIFKNQTIIQCKVQEGSKQPYIFDGIIYYRKFDKVRKATSSEVSRLIHNRQEDELHWERQIHLGIMPGDLDRKFIKTTFDLGKKNRRISPFEEDREKLLVKYGLLSNNYVTNAGGILFAKDGARFYRQAKVRITEFAGSKTSDSLLRDELLEGSLFSLVEHLESFVNTVV